MPVADRTEDPSVEELAAMSEDERVQYFLAHPLEGQDPAVDPVFVARSRARFVLSILKRDEEQRRSQRAS